MFIEEYIGLTVVLTLTTQEILHEIQSDNFVSLIFVKNTKKHIRKIMEHNKQLDFMVTRKLLLHLEPAVVFAITKNLERISGYSKEIEILLPKALLSASVSDVPISMQQIRIRLETVTYQIITALNQLNTLLKEIDS